MEATSWKLLNLKCSLCNLKLSEALEFLLIFFSIIPKMLNHSDIPGLSPYKSDADMAAVQLYKDYPDSLLQFGYVCCLIFCLVGIPGNLVTIIALSMCEKFRNAIAYFIINLHVNNLIYCCMILPMTAVIFSTKQWVFGITMCSVYALMKYVLVGTAHFTVVAITINRYIIVCHPHIYHRLYKRSVLISTLLFTWIAPFVMFYPTFMQAWGRFDLDPIGGNCSIVPDLNKHSPKTFFVVFAFVGPYLIISICYARMWWTVRKATRRRNAYNKPTTPTTISVSVSDCSIAKTEGAYDEVATYESSTDNENNKMNNCNLLSPNNQENSVVNILKTPFKSFRKINKPHLPTRKDKKLATMIVAILTAFIICHLPLMVARISQVDYKMNYNVNILAHLLEYSAAFTSPLIYVLISREYRQVYGCLFKSIKAKFANNSV